MKLNSTLLPSKRDSSAVTAQQMRAVKANTADSYQYSYQLSSLQSSVSRSTLLSDTSSQTSSSNVHWSQHHRIKVFKPMILKYRQSKCSRTEMCTTAHSRKQIWPWQVSSLPKTKADNSANKYNKIS